MADPELLPIVAARRIGHRFTGNQPFQREVARIAEDVYERYWAIVRSLVDREHMTVAEARTVMPNLEIDARDLRLDRRPPVPEPVVPEARNPWLRRSAKRRPRY